MRHVLTLATTALLLYSTEVLAQNQWLHFPEEASQSAVFIGDLNIIGGQLTIEALMTRYVSGGSLVSKNNANEMGYLLRPERFWIGTSVGVQYVENPCVLADEETYHIAGTYDGDSLRFYLNGLKVNAVAHTGTLAQNGIQTALGNWSNTLNDQYMGYLDEVRIWGVARTQEEIMSNMFDLPDPTAQSDLFAYYKFNGDLTNLQGNASWNGTVVGSQAELGTNLFAQDGMVSSPDCTPCGRRATGFGQQGVNFVDISTHTIAGRSDNCEAAIQQASGRIIMGGWYREAAGGNGWNWALAGLTEDGQLDTTFGTAGKVKLTQDILSANSRGYALALDTTTQHFYQAGVGRNGNSGPFSFTAVRYLPDGTMDGTFGNAGRLFEDRLGTSSARAATVLDGQLILAGEIGNAPACTKYWNDGTPDPLFGNDDLPGVSMVPGLPGAFSTGMFRDMMIDPSDSSIIAVGHWALDVLVVRFTKNGTLDQSFAGTGWALYDPDGFGYTCLANAVDMDHFGRIVITGTARSDTRTLVMRLLPDGTPDPMFGDNGAVMLNPGSNTSRGFDVLVQTDCKVIVAGETHTGLVSVRPHMLLRFMPDGELDDSFGVTGVMIDDFPVGANDNGAWKALLWSNAGSLIAAGEGYSQSGTFPDFCAAEYFGCLEPLTDCLEISTGSDEDITMRDHQLLVIHPNPTDGMVLLQFPSSARPHSIELADAMGRRIHLQSNLPYQDQLMVDLAGFVAGVYFVHVHFTEGPAVVKRVVKK